MSDLITLRRPDDWHVHLRDGALLKAVAPYTAAQFARAIIMPNLEKPITTVAAARSYRARILAALTETKAETHNFTPLMTCYLTGDASAEEITRGFVEGVFTACKLYPAGATTNSSHGVVNIQNIYPVLEAMQGTGMPLLVHGEVTDPDIDIFDREAVFIETVLIPLMLRYPDLKIVFEHITTKEAADFVSEAGEHLGATITPHHLEFNRNAIFKGGIRPHYYCLPVAKREKHRQALRRAATSGSSKFFLGTDSAPHLVETKETSCGCAGLFNAPAALESYAQTFDEEGALDKLEGFASLNGPRFYGLEPNDARITLKRVPKKIPEKILAAGSHIIPFRGAEEIGWSYQDIVKPV